MGKSKGGGGKKGGGPPPPPQAAQQDPFPPQPSTWPEDVIYISDCLWDKSVPQDVLLKYHKVGRREPDKPIKPGRCKNVKFMRITDPSHPACGQNGLFAATRIHAKAHIIDYVGYVLLDGQENKESDYTLRLGDVCVDADKMGNEARMTNDFRNTGKKQNARFDSRTDPQGSTRMAVWAGEKDIKKGEEILVSYGKGYWAARGLLPGGGGWEEWEGAEHDKRDGEGVAAE